MKIRRRHARAALSDQKLWFCNGLSTHDKCSSLPVAGFSSGADDWPELREAFDILRSKFPQGRATLTLALLPPLVHVRTTLRRGLKDREIAMLIRRDPGRYFLHGSGAGSVTVMPGMGKDDALLIHTPEHVLDAITTAAEQAGWILSAAAPGQYAWAAEARRTRARVVAVDMGRTTHMLRVVRGRIVAARTVLSSAPEQEWQAAIALDAVENSDLPPRSDDARLRLVLGGRSAPSAENVEGESENVWAGRRAACGRMPWYAPAIRNCTMQRRHDRGLVRRATLLAAAGVAALLLGDVVRLIRIQSELNDIDRARAGIRGAATAAAAARERALDDSSATQALLSDAAIPPSWAEVLAHVAYALPKTAFLTRVVGSTDSLMIEARSLNPALALEALTAIPGVTNVHIVHASEDALDDAGRRSVVIAAHVRRVLVPTGSE